MKDNIGLILAAAVMCGIHLGTAHMAYKAGQNMGYAAGHYAGRTSVPGPMTLAATEETYTPANIYYRRGGTVVDEAGWLGYGITFPDSSEAQRFVYQLAELQKNYRPQ